MPYYIKKKKGRGGAVGKADRQFSRFIRLRDALPGGAFKCISCGQFKPIEQADCGHFHSRTHMATRFSELNAHAECRHCNRFSADHLTHYQSNLIAKIGQNQFDMLAVQAASVCKISEFELAEIAKLYKAKADKLSREKGINI